jgi:hypothetical protein
MKEKLQKEDFGMRKEPKHGAVRNDFGRVSGRCSRWPSEVASKGEHQLHSRFRYLCGR